MNKSSHHLHSADTKISYCCVCGGAYDMENDYYLTSECDRDGYTFPFYDEQVRMGALPSCNSNYSNCGYIVVALF